MGNRGNTRENHS